MISNPASRSAARIAGAEKPRARKAFAMAMNGVTFSARWAIAL